ncbi:MAG: cytochrome c oxidase subunit I [Actinobacteria bacterium RBG_16_68_21]|nr:MAG: cytochrome c oxidase subunit I [Actinobacteria bacterium RBG_16_68_21]
MATLNPAVESATASHHGRKGVWSWMTTTDHKRIGLLYGVSSLLFFLVGGVEALLIRLQLAAADGTVLSADAYNQMFTMHATTMVFLVIMPAAAAFTNYLLPILLGARDVAFPRLNALSYWIYIFGGLFLTISFFVGGAPDGGWFGYAPLSTQVTEIVRMDYWALGVQILGLASLLSAINFITTVFTMRAPGMTLMRMPVFAWMATVVAFLLLFSLPIIAVGLFEVFLDRNLGTLFFDAAAGGTPLLWQHLFWLFGHPEVYILILPAMGIVSEVLPVFSRKPLFGRSFVIFSGIAIGFMGFGVWAHHMFVAGLGPVAEATFALTTMLIAVPTGVKIFNWIGTVWGGSVRLATPMLFSLGFIAMFVIGGLSGVTHSIVPSDTQQHDTYYIVAHFHYVLFGGAVFGLFGGIYYWWPKITGKLLNEGLGKLHFWLMLIGFNLTFAPMHILGLRGMPRRTYRYPKGLGFEFWNFIATVGSLTIAVSILIFLINAWRTKARGRVAGNDPWDGRTLEWSISSPPPEHNFDVVPVVHAEDDFWHRKYREDEEGRPVPIPGGGDPLVAGPDDPPIHLPSPSFYPILAAFGMFLTVLGLVYVPLGLVLAGVGVVTVVWGLFGWSMEPLTREEH